ncbi:hypothetical protein PIB30_014239 [Stylosanthes scabra]|uniref:Uncharacterized protein n=1 Tax=Stylosanthes scabra TaxID=79078 RepID=A0ABU6X871_9FABA|nr:hypothetical protein [Stylosanthes scabra]
MGRGGGYLPTPRSRPPNHSPSPSPSPPHYPLRENFRPHPYSLQILHFSRIFREFEDEIRNSPLRSLPLSRGDFAPSSSIRKKFSAFESPFEAFPRRWGILTPPSYIQTHTNYTIILPHLGLVNPLIGHSNDVAAHKRHITRPTHKLSSIFS